MQHYIRFHVVWPPNLVVIYRDYFVFQMIAELCVSAGIVGKQSLFVSALFVLGDSEVLHALAS